ncbi:MAG: hypothetical protein ACXWK5_07175 [Myxococcaceae bacterium]
MIPQLLLRQLYTAGSLTNAAGGARFSLKNRLSDVTLTRIVGGTHRQAGDRRRRAAGGHG